MKNATNSYGYYLTEDSETIEFRGNFEKNNIFLRTKNPDEQLNYKVFVSPKKAINFAIQIVGGTNPQVVYIPQHIYKDLQIAYSENNPYYTIKDITIIKLDFTDSGNGLVTYLKTKYETTKGTDLSKIGNAGSTGIKSYAGFDGAGNPIDEDILKQILYLFEEQNDIIFVDKDIQMVTDDIVKARGYKSNRILGDFTFISNYFDSSGKFKESLLNSAENIKIEDTTIKSILQLPDFLKDTTDKTLTDVNSIYKNNITLEEKIINAPKVLGLAMNGLSKVAPLFGGAKDKLSQIKAQRAQKKLAESKALGSSSLGQTTVSDSGVSGAATGTLNTNKGLFSTSNSLGSQYKKSVTLKAEGGESNKFNIPPKDAVSNKITIPSSRDAEIKKIQDKFNAEQDEIFMREKAARLSGLDDSYDEDELGNRVYDDPADTIKYQNTLANIKKKAAMDRAEESLLDIKTTPNSNRFTIPTTPSSNPFTISPSSGVSNSIILPASGGKSNTFSISQTPAGTNSIILPASGGKSNTVSIPRTAAGANSIILPASGGKSNTFSIGNKP